MSGIANHQKMECCCVNVQQDQELSAFQALVQQAAAANSSLQPSAYKSFYPQLDFEQGKNVSLFLHERYDFLKIYCQNLNNASRQIDDLAQKYNDQCQALKKKL